MNRGNIPGFYFDEEKNKYFKIQPNHTVSSQIKYSASNVRHEAREKRKIKRQKTEERRRNEQTVTIARPLASALLNRCTLQRELGVATSVIYHSHRDTAFVQGLESRDVKIQLQGFAETSTSITDAQRIDDHMLLSVTHDSGSHAVYAYPYDGEWQRRNVRLAGKRPVVAFPQQVTMEGVMVGGRSNVLACGNQLASAYYYFGPAETEPYDTLFPIKQLKGVRNLFDFRISKDAESVAFAGTGGVVVHALEPHITAAKMPLNDSDEAFAVDWLHPNVLAIGTTRELPDEHFSHHACLWDIRVKPDQHGAGYSARVKRYHRITGLAVPSSNNLLIASNREIGLYDLRMLSPEQPPVLRIQHESQGARLNFALHQETGLVAAADQYNKAHVYSLRTGKHVRTMKSPGAANYGVLMQKLRWQEDGNGSPYLQTCSRDVICKWSW